MFDHSYNQEDIEEQDHFTRPLMIFKEQNEN